KFMTYDAKPRRFSAEEMETARVVAGQVAFAIARRRHDAELADLYHEAERARLSAEQSAQARENLLAVVSHDLRNPLGALVTSAALLRRRPGDDSAASRVLRHVDTILRSADRMTWLIRDLLDLARVDAGKLVLDPAPEPVAEMLEESVEMLRPIAEQKRI